MEQKNEKATVSMLDVKISVSVLICVLVATVLGNIGFKFSLGDMKLEIIQKMTACIACLLCCQDDTKISLKAGINRIIITVIGGLVGIVVILLDNFVNNQWLMAIFICLGILLTLFLCKAAKVPYINARIGGVTFILVACTLSGTARIYYGIFRLISTVFAVLVVLLVTWFYDKIQSRKNK